MGFSWYSKVTKLDQDDIMVHLVVSFLNLKEDASKWSLLGGRHGRAVQSKPCSIAGSIQGYTSALVVLQRLEFIKRPADWAFHVLAYVRDIRLNPAFSGFGSA